MIKKYTVSLKDIAVATGVSISTVSRVIQKKGEIAPDTRSKIMNAAQELGYHENRLSNAIRTGKTGVVGFIGSVGDSFFNKLFVLIHEELRKRNYLPIVSWQVNHDQEVIKRMIEQRVDGIIIVPTVDHADDDYYREVTERGLPIVAIDRKIPADIDFVGTDDYAGGWMMAEYLYGQGHRRMGFYHCCPDASPANLRKKGFLDFCNRHPDCSVALAGHCGWDLEEDWILIDFFNAHPEITAIGTITDFHAMQLADVIAKIGKRIPDDVSVVGFGNLDDQWILHRQLTTFDQKGDELAKVAVDLLFERMNGSVNPKVEYRVKPKLIVRNSTGKRRK